MSDKMTIVDAIRTVLRNSSLALATVEIFDAIVRQKLYEFKALDPKAVVRAQLRRHCVGLEFPSASPVKYFSINSDGKYSLADSCDYSEHGGADLQDKERIPEEIVDEAHRAHLEDLREQLKEKILQNHPAFFERLVIDLLIKMGYGGGDPSLGFHTGGPGDRGIDGIIREDKLGLEEIYIQAKRYKLDSAVGSDEVQQFAGAMNKVRKGVFITTARFTDAAVEAAEKHEKAIKLINGDMLCDLMVTAGVGISEIKNYTIFRVDSDYFSASD